MNDDHRPRRAGTPRIGGDGELEVFAADEQGDVEVDLERWRDLATAVLADLGVRGAAELSLLFVNEDEGYHRLLLKYGTITEDLGGGVTRDVELEACTLLVDKDGQQAFMVTISQPSFASTEPYSFSVPGVADEIEVVVP